MTEYAALFERDNHEAWPAYAKEQGEEEPGDIEELAEQDDDADGEAPASDQKEMKVDGETAGDDEQK
ncbi:MAG: hypothetical protein IJ087_13105, partial [Eggerthellaceae bacterium]|nr:hypothetical protein [Eggerthellaceae bacterium]